jgi:hypothetical protein
MKPTRHTHKQGFNGATKRQFYGPSKNNTSSKSQKSSHTSSFTKHQYLIHQPLIQQNTTINLETLESHKSH